MSSLALSIEEAPRRAQRPVLAEAHDAVLNDLCAELFASLPRSDQRKKGRDYLWCLLGTHGRKTIRNIAMLLGGQAAEQSLHHFVSGSTWDWGPVRQALARYVARVAPPHAYVLRPLVIPKTGESTVGVEKRYFPALGQVLSAQQAVGVWAGSSALCSPINWRLHLPRSWVDDEDRRRRSAIPHEVVPETHAECALAAYLEITEDWGLPTRPVVLDAAGPDPAGTVSRIRAARRGPFLARVGHMLRLVVADPALPGRGPEPLPAYQILGVARRLRRPVVWPGRTAGTATPALVAGVRVRLPAAPRGTGPEPTSGELLLLGVGADGQRWPAEVWLTDMTDAQPAPLLRTAHLLHRVDHDVVRIGDRVGIRDYTGRSFGGWHRHVTLASAAHAVAALCEADGRRLPRTAA